MDRGNIHGGWLSIRDYHASQLVDKRVLSLSLSLCVHTTIVKTDTDAASLPYLLPDSRHAAANGTSLTWLVTWRTGSTWRAASVCCYRLINGITVEYLTSRVAAVPSQTLDRHNV